MPGDSQTDKPTPADGDMFIVWAMGGLLDDNTVTKHSTDYPGPGGCAHAMMTLSCNTTYDAYRILHVLVNQ